jgi:hypothetical protein
MDASDKPSQLLFFDRSAFRYRPFAIMTGMFVLDLLICIIFIVGGWRRLSIFGVFFIVFAIVYLVGIWTTALQVHANIRLMFETGQLGNPEKGSPLYKVLTITTNLLTAGFIASFMLVGYCLAVVADVFPSR